MRYKKGDFEVEVQGDKVFVEEKFKQLLALQTKMPERILRSGVDVNSVDTGEKPALNEFLISKGTKLSHGDKILVFGYYLDKFGNQNSFNIKEIDECYKKTRTPPPKNFPQYIAGLVRQGYLMDAPEKKDSKKAWQLTTNGMQYVESLGV